MDRRLIFVFVGLALAVPSDLVTNLPGVPAECNPTQYAGFVQVDQAHNGSLFYWFVESSDVAKPVLIWLNGGPGASSLMGLLVENGPFTLSNGSLVCNPHSWSNEAHILYVDQPVGTGWSFVDPSGLVSDEDVLGSQFVTLLVGFFDRHPEFASNPLFLSGESYAGKYIPYIAQAILNYNAEARNKIAFHGVAIGNGLMDPLPQFLSIVEYANGLGFLDANQALALEKTWEDCYHQYNKPNLTEAARICLTMMDKVVEYSGNAFLYDVRSFDPHVLDNVSTDILNYLSSPQVMQAIHTVGQEWKSGDGTSTPNPVSAALYDDLLKQGPKQIIETLLKSGLRVLIYEGTYDMSVCNHIGVTRMVDALSWGGQFVWQTLTQAVWTSAISGKTAGTIKHLDNLAYIKIFDCGHLVPMNQPGHSLEMIQAFLNGSWTSLAPPATRPAAISAVQPQEALLPSN